VTPQIRLVVSLNYIQLASRPAGRRCHLIFSTLRGMLVALLHACLPCEQPRPRSAECVATSAAEAQYCNERVCLSSVCLHVYRVNDTSELHQIFVRFTRGRVSVLLGRRCITLYVMHFQFMDDVMFSYNGLNDGVTLQQHCCNGVCGQKPLLRGIRLVASSPR